MSSPNILEALADLYNQAANEKSHYYTAKVVAEALLELQRLYAIERKLEEIKRVLT